MFILAPYSQDSCAMEESDTLFLSSEIQTETRATWQIQSFLEHKQRMWLEPAYKADIGKGWEWSCPYT